MRSVPLLTILLSALLTPAIPSSEAQSAGCTPCECGVAFCRDGAQYSVRYGPILVSRSNDTVQIRWSMALAQELGPENPDESFDAVVDVRWSNESLAEEAGEVPYSLRRQVVIPGNQSLTVVWPDSKPIYVVLSALAKDSNETYDPPARRLAAGGDAAHPSFLLTTVGFVALLLLRRRTRPRRFPAV